MLFTTPLFVLATLFGLISSGMSIEVFKGSLENGSLLELDKRSPQHVSADSIGNLNTVISLINKYRVAHQVSPLVWNNTLAQYAMNVAYPCKFRPSRGPYGETLAGSSTVNNPEWFVWFLYREVDNYDFKNPDIVNPGTKHFVQMVWAGTKQVGCAFVDGCPDLRYQLWCEFFPKGNVGSQLAYRNNVKVADRTKEIPGMPAAIITN